jgi:hypothetical protein
MILNLIESKQVHIFQASTAQTSDHLRVTIHIKDGKFEKAETIPPLPKSREDWMFFALVAQKIEELTTHASTMEEWTVKELGNLPSARTPDDLVKAFDQETKEEPSATGH